MNLMSACGASGSIKPGVKRSGTPAIESARARDAGDSLYITASLPPAPRARFFFGLQTWGSAALHPRLYAIACSAG
jgi:hypothetical protein